MPGKERANTETDILVIDYRLDGLKRYVTDIIKELRKINPKLKIAVMIGMGSIA